VAKAALSKGGLTALDGRSAEARALKAWKAEIVADLGGDLSAQQLTLLDSAAVSMALLAVADAYLRELGAGIVNRKRKTFVPLVQERLRVAQHVADTLKTLGLARVAKTVPALAEVMS
jgi:hypothetical protein